MCSDVRAGHRSDSAVTKIYITEAPKSHAHASDALDDGPYIAYVMIQMFKFGTALLVKRWPSLR